MSDFIETEGTFIAGIIMLVLLVAGASYWQAQANATPAPSTTTPPQTTVATTTRTGASAPTQPKKRSVYAATTTQPSTPPLIGKPSVRGGGEREYHDD